MFSSFTGKVRVVKGSNPSKPAPAMSARISDHSGEAFPALTTHVTAPSAHRILGSAAIPVIGRSTASVSVCRTCRRVKSTVWTHRVSLNMAAKRAEWVLRVIPVKAGMQQSQPWFPLDLRPDYEEASRFSRNAF